MQWWYWNFVPIGGCKGISKAVACDFKKCPKLRSLYLERSSKPKCCIIFLFPMFMVNTRNFQKKIWRIPMQQQYTLNEDIFMVKLSRSFCLCGYHMSFKDIVRVNMFLISLSSLKQIHTEWSYSVSTAKCAEIYFASLSFKYPPDTNWPISGCLRRGDTFLLTTFSHLLLWSEQVIQPMWSLYERTVALQSIRILFHQPVDKKWQLVPNGWLILHFMLLIHYCNLVGRPKNNIKALSAKDARNWAKCWFTFELFTCTNCFTVANVGRFKGDEVVRRDS